MERMAEAVPDSDEQVLQNLLTHSSWEQGNGQVGVFGWLISTDHACT